MEATHPHLDEFLAAYIECALWSTSDESDESGGNPLDDNYGLEDLHPDTTEACREDCARFLRQWGDDIAADASRVQTTYSVWAQAGHDFWLTRNGHGCGFWDGDWPKPLDQLLTKSAHTFGGVDLYVGDDGKIYL